MQADRVLLERAVRDLELNCTLVRPPRLTGVYRIGPAWRALAVQG
jgi:hypothetical protein